MEVTILMDAYKILSYLQNKKNVLLMGAPGTGKSMLMNEVALAFESAVTIAAPTNIPGAAIPIPANPEPNTIGALPLMQRNNRKVFRTTLHQNSKYRDFLTGITPTCDGNEGFQISKGILYRANEFAKQPDSAALLIIDELNRGPAIEVFGGSLVALESNKRLSNENTPTPNTHYFEILSPTTSDYEEYALSPHLYILAAINQADVSVAPLDVAFLRRWQSTLLLPDYTSLYDNFGVNADDTIAETSTCAQDVYAVAIKALETINKKITAGRGAEYQLGQGVFLSTQPEGNTVDKALDFVLDCWSMIYSHLSELFFGDVNAMAYLLNADANGSPYHLQEVNFAGETRNVLTCDNLTHENIYSLYCSLLEDPDQ